MQRVMMMPVFRSCRTVLLFSLTALLTGCGAAQVASPVQPPTSLAPDLTAADLKQAAVDAYDRGFEAGRRYQRKHDEAQAGASLPDSPQPDTTAQAATTAPAPATPPADGKAPAQASCPPQAATPQLPPTPISPLPPSSNYTTSGPAKPLSQ